VSAALTAKRSVHDYYTLPGDEKILPQVLTAGDTLIVNFGGTSIDEVLNGAAERVEQGGTSFRTTVNNDGELLFNGGTAILTTVNAGGFAQVTGGTIDQTTINQGDVVLLNHSTAANTQLNFLSQAALSQLEVKEGSTAINTFIDAVSAVNVDATSTLDTVTFLHSRNDVFATVAVENPLSLTGSINNLDVMDFLQFGGLAPGHDVIVHSFQLSQDHSVLTITYNNNQNATYHLTGMAPHTTLKLSVGMENGSIFSQLEPVLSPSAIQDDYLAITRTSLSPDQATPILNAIDAGTQTETQYVSDLLSQVSNTTVPAVAVEGSMYLSVGTSAEITSLATQFLPSQVVFATQHGLNAEVYASEAMGLALASINETGSTAFATNFGPANAAMPNSTAGDLAFATAAAAAIFGSASTANLINVMDAWVTNWKAFYTGNGLPGIANPTAAQIDLAARGAAWGDAVGAALDNNLGPLKGLATNVLMDAAEGIAGYSMSLVGQPAHQPFQA
jgi:hypothetical protein